MKLATLVLCVVACLFGVGLSLHAEGVLAVATSPLIGQPDLEDALAEYEQALGSQGMTFDFVVLDSPSCEQRFGSRVRDIRDWEEIRRVLEAVLAGTGHSMVLLLGGTRVIPRPVMEIRQGDRILDAETDAWYVDFDRDNIVDEGFSVGRMASLYEDASAVVTQLRYAAAIHTTTGLLFHARLDLDETTTPPLGVGYACSDPEGLFSLMSESDLIFFWGHGSPTEINTMYWETILDVPSIPRINLQDRHPVIIALNPCYAGMLLEDEPSFATEFTRNGAAAYIANTMAEGFTTVMRDEFLDALQHRVPIGPALFGAMRYSITSWANGTGYPPYVTSQQFVLYGDPSLRGW